MSLLNISAHSSKVQIILHGHKNTIMAEKCKINAMILQNIYISPTVPNMSWQHLFLSQDQIVDYKALCCQISLVRLILEKPSPFISEEPRLVTLQAPLHPEFCCFLVRMRPDPLARACRRGAVAFPSASLLEDRYCWLRLIGWLRRCVPDRSLLTHLPGPRHPRFVWLPCPPASHPMVSVSTRDPCPRSQVAGS